MRSPDHSPAAPHAGHLIAQTLEAHRVDRVFVVPGESFLALLDGLHDATIDTVVCRHEGGAAYMADATARLTGRPGVAAVTRGPGAANAFVAVHAAWQDAVPLVLLVGLIPVADRGRESFQEFDPQAWFGTQAKRVLVLEEPHRAGEVVAEAMHIAASGRPGPVIVGLPEDILALPAAAPVAEPRPVAEGGLEAGDLDQLTELLSRSERPCLYVGGSGWTATASTELARFAETNAIPVVQEWRSSDRVAFDSPANAGWLGYGHPAPAARLVFESDVVLCVGGLLGDVATDGYRLRTEADAAVVVLSPDPELRGFDGAATAQFTVSVPVATRALAGIDLARQRDWRSRFEAARTAHAQFTVLEPGLDERPTAPGTAHMGEVFAEVLKRLPEDALVTFGAGNHTSWAQRYFPTRRFPSLLSLRNGSMGYSIPAAVAAAIGDPTRLVVSVAGDGEFLMNGQELAVAASAGAAFLALVVDNQGYGTIRSHQESTYPDRPSGTALRNPDFAALARSFGAHGERIDDDAQAAAAVDRALAAIAAGRPAVIHVVIDPTLSLA